MARCLHVSLYGTKEFDILLSSVSTDWNLYRLANVLGIKYSQMSLTYCYTVTIPTQTFNAWEKCRCLVWVFHLWFHLLSAQKFAANYFLELNDHLLYNSPRHSLGHSIPLSQPFILSRDLCLFSSSNQTHKFLLNLLLYIFDVLFAFSLFHFLATVTPSVWSILQY